MNLKISLFALLLCISFCQCKIKEEPISHLEQNTHQPSNNSEDIGSEGLTNQKMESSTVVQDTSINTSKRYMQELEDNISVNADFSGILKTLVPNSNGQLATHFFTISYNPNYTIKEFRGDDSYVLVIDSENQELYAEAEYSFLSTIKQKFLNKQSLNSLKGSTEISNEVIVVTKETDSKFRNVSGNVYLRMDVDNYRNVLIFSSTENEVANFAELLKTVKKLDR